jgi:hypothetical protein
MRRVLLVALVAGVVAGIVVAVAVPRERSAGQRTLVKKPQRQVPRTGPVGFPLGAIAGSERRELRVDDPHGGPDWALRTYRAKPVPPPGLPPGAAPPDDGRPFCAQLGRIVDGEFGWIDGTNTFRPAGHSTGEAPTGCADGPPGPPILRAYTFAADTDRTEGRLTHTVVFGIGGDDTRAVDLRLGGRRARPRVSGAGAFLAFAEPDVRVRSVRARFEFDARTAVELRPEFGLGFRPSGLPSALNDEQRPDHGQPRIVARAPDPHDGLPWGLGVVPSRRHGDCFVGPARIVGGRLGSVGHELGTFDDGEITSGLRCPHKIHRKYGVNVGFLPGRSSFVSDLTSGDPEPGRTARRTLPGVSVVFGRARADVESVTIATPRDVRTLPTAGPDHAFVATYDGGFEAGMVTVTAHFRGGDSRVIERFEIGH